MGDAVLTACGGAWSPGWGAEPGARSGGCLKGTGAPGRDGGRVEPMWEPGGGAGGHLEPGMGAHLEPEPGIGGVVLTAWNHGEAGVGRHLEPGMGGTPCGSLEVGMGGAWNQPPGAQLGARLGVRSITGEGEAGTWNQAPDSLWALTWSRQWDCWSSLGAHRMAPWVVLSHFPVLPVAYV